MAIDVRELSTRVLDPVIAEELDIYEKHRRGVPRRPDRRGRLPRLPPEPRRLRPAPGRPQPDAADQDPVRQAHRRAARDVRLHLRDVLAGLGSPHHPPERPVPLRRAREDAGDPAPAGVGRAHVPRGVRRHRPQRDGLPPRRRVPAGEARHQPVGRGDRALVAAPPLRAAPAPQVQDQLLGLRHRLRPGHVQRRRRDRDHAHPRRRHRRARLPGVRGRRSRRQPARRRRRSRSSPPAKTSCPRSRRACAPSTTTATATTRSAPA